MSGSRTDYIQSHYEFVSLMAFFFSLYQKIFQIKMHLLAKKANKLRKRLLEHMVVLT